MSNQHVSARTRFWGNVAEHRKPDACWPWHGATSHGYGIVNVDGRKTYAHRFSLVLHGRKIRAAHVVDHLCSNRSCVNPAHLDVVSFAENVRRGNRLNMIRRRIKRGQYVP